MKASVVGTRCSAVRRLSVALVVALGLGAVSCGPPAPVVQGQVVSIEAKTLSVQDETRPDAPPIVLDIATAEIGNLPAVGDVVRVAYRTEGGANRALAVMNVTRQEQNEGKAP